MADLAAIDTFSIGPSRSRGRIGDAGRIPALDGVRCLSIVLVIMSHICTLELPHDRAVDALASAYGRVGVTIFFVVSGYLITTLLLRERRQSGRIDFKGFILRRVYRIMPAYYAMLAVVALLGAATPRSVIVSAVLMRDYGLGTTSFILGHTWSLGVEEKFYLLWPFAAASLTRRQLTWLGLVVMATLPAVRVATYVFAPASRDLITIMFHTRADTLAAGCLLAILFEVDSPVAVRRTRLKARLSSRPAAAAAAIVLFAASPILTACFGGAYLLPIGLTVDGVSASVLVACSVYNPPAFLAMLLNARLPVMLGVMSYSLYLWQQMAFDPVTGWLSSLGYRLIFLAAVAPISYYGIERPCTALRRRWHGGALAS